MRGDEGAFDGLKQHLVEVFERSPELARQVADHLGVSIEVREVSIEISPSASVAESRDYVTDFDGTKTECETVDEFLKWMYGQEGLEYFHTRWVEMQEELKAAGITDAGRVINTSWMQAVVETSDYYASQGFSPITREKLREFGSKFGSEEMKEFGEYSDGAIDLLKGMRDEAKRAGVPFRVHIVTAGFEELVKSTRLVRECGVDSVQGSNFDYDERGAVKLTEVRPEADNPRHVQITRRVFGPNGLYTEQPVWVTDEKCVSRPDKIARIQNIQDGHWVSLNGTQPEPVMGKNMCYLGDGLTDGPALKHIRDIGGTPIAVFNPNNSEFKNAVRLLNNYSLQDMLPRMYSDPTTSDALLSKWFRAGVGRPMGSGVSVKKRTVEITIPAGLGDKSD